MIYGHGDDGYCTDVNIVADFSTNVWYGAESEPLVRFLQKRIPMILHYPEPNADSFAAAVAEFHGVGEDSILVGNGETELLYMIAQAFRGAQSVIFIPSYAEYADACELHGHKVHYLHYGTELPADNGELVIIGNPNNPNGKLISREQIVATLEASPNRVLVVDEAFIDFTIGDNSVVDLVEKYNNLIVVRSMTNKFAIPGLRLGYMVASPELIEKVGRFAYPWRVNSLAIEAGKFLLQRKDTLSGSLPTIMQRKENLQAAILRIKGYEPKEKPDDRFYDVMRELSAIGNNLHQLTAKANALGFIDAPLLRKETEKWNKFQCEVERLILRPEKSDMKWQ